VEAVSFGSPVRFSDDEVPTVSGAIVDTEEDIENLRVPAVGDGRTGEYIKTLELATQKITHVPVFAGSIGPFSLAGRLMDMTEIMVKCFTEPELVHATLEKTTEFLISYNLAFRAAGANGLVMAEPASGLLSPDLIAEFSTPYVRRIIQAIEREDFLVVYHNCGNTIPLIGSILETGARAFHFGNAIDLSEMLKLVPADRIVMGNVDPASQFRNGTPESIREATLNVLNRCSGYPNFIISSGCDIPPLSPIENIDSFFRTIKEFYA
ncbi:MAG: uroporphyrinogen decarboxylase family protein, partial [Oscillospiraceae bacterium]|nr:uroporphyrinogen decarboxylase family protein [Oscillospiraceae bacterium]